MTRRLLATYLTITTMVLLMVVVPLGITFAARERDRLGFDIERDAHAFAARVEEPLETGRRPPVDRVTLQYRQTGGRVVVTDAHGMSVLDSDDPRGAPRRFDDRPEVRLALQGRAATGRRYSSTLGQTLVFVAVPVASGGLVHGVVRISVPTSVVDGRVRSTWLNLGLLSVVTLVTVAAVGIVLARSVTRPVRELTDAAERLADGDLDSRVALRSGPPELRALGATFDATVARLAQLLEAQRSFVSDASHQLRTPLTALRLRLETMAPGDGASEAKVDAALAEVTRLSSLVESLLELARADAADPPIGTVDLSVAVHERAAVWEAVAAEQGVEIRVRAPEPVLVRAVHGALEQILDNLVSNALDVAPAGSLVLLEARATPDLAELHVVDEGPGMADDQRQQAFARFWRPTGAERGGFGLGLAIVDQLARAGGGDARLDPAPSGHGLDAVVRFPVAAAEGPPHA